MSQPTVAFPPAEGIPGTPALSLPVLIAGCVARLGVWVIVIEVIAGQRVLESRQGKKDGKEVNLIGSGDQPCCPDPWRAHIIRYIVFCLQ